ncbi:MAG TPA: hypothetical protein VD969_15780 [Symbiobacteriaceae bacterium]|nr:hypothetical protein [Symbiobacteriaceae bacterium]
MSSILTAAPTPGGPAPLSTVRIILLHLLPETVALLGYLVLAPTFARSNLPTFWALAVTTLCLVVPLQFGLLLWLGWREHGRLSLGRIVLNRDRTPFVQYFWLLPLLLAWILFVTLGIGAPLYKLIPGLFRAWLPNLVPTGALLPLPEQLATGSRTMLLGVTFTLMAIRLMVGSLVDEYYYRGYLLPRMTNLGRWAPLVSILLSSVSVAGTPWQTLLPSVGLLPAVYAVWWKRDLRITVGTRWMYGALDILRLLLNYRQVI